MWCGPLNGRGACQGAGQRRSSTLRLARPAAMLASGMDCVLRLLGVFEGTIECVRPGGDGYPNVTPRVQRRVSWTVSSESEWCRL